MFDFERRRIEELGALGNFILYAGRVFRSNAIRNATEWARNKLYGLATGLRTPTQ